MELGQRLRQARLEAGLSQRQLCGETITRNMLSQIENGSARPSMDTLRYLAGRLGKPISFFLEDGEAVSPNGQTVMQARQAYTRQAYAQALTLLQAYRKPDPVFDPEHGLLLVLTLLALAEKALSEGRQPYAQTLLEQAGQADSPYITPELTRRRLLLLAQACPDRRDALLEQLPPDDEALLLRAEAALARKDAAEAAVLLDAARCKTAAQWRFLRGLAAFSQGSCPDAIRYFTLAEPELPHKTAPLLEQCYQQTEDYKMAYLYACKQRQKK